MNARLESLAREKELLLASSALCRLRLGLEVHDARSALHWKRVAVAAVTAQGARLLVLEVALSIVGLSRAARWVVVASRVLLVAKLARSMVG